MQRYRRCNRPPRGWYCEGNLNHPGACPTIPRWWTRLLMYFGW